MQLKRRNCPNWWCSNPVVALSPGRGDNCRQHLHNRIRRCCPAERPRCRRSGGKLQVATRKQDVTNHEGCACGATMADLKCWVKKAMLYISSQLHLPPADEIYLANSILCPSTHSYCIDMYIDTTHCIIVLNVRRTLPISIGCLCDAQLRDCNLPHSLPAMVIMITNMRAQL